MRPIHFSMLRTKAGRRVLLLLLLSLFTDIVVLVYAPSHPAVAAAPNTNCALIMPAQQGLDTPYLLVATNLQAGPCHEANAKLAAFVQVLLHSPVMVTLTPVRGDAMTVCASSPVPAYYRVQSAVRSPACVIDYGMGKLIIPGSARVGLPYLRH
jgi:hypothetical protein